MSKYLTPEIILVNTQIPENLGAAARAMLNFNLSKLRLVSPSFAMSNEKIIPVSAGAFKILKKIRKFESFEESINAAAESAERILKRRREKERVI